MKGVVPGGDEAPAARILHPAARQFDPMTGNPT